jgi:plasmid stabilization system protein ParE
MLPYVLTPDAERDLREVARYTLRQWGARQQRRYASLLEAEFRAIAQRRIVPRLFSPDYPDVFVSRCGHHYVFYVHSEGQKPRIFAVFHENMDLLAHLAGRLVP